MPAGPNELFDAQCPHCAGIAKFPLAALGKTAKCPNCGKQYQLPKRPSVSTRVKSRAADAEQAVIVKLFVVGLLVFLVTLIIFWARGKGPSLTGHYVAYGAIAVCVATSQRLREMGRIAKTDGQKMMTRFGLFFLLATIACLGLAGRTHFRIVQEAREANRERTPEEEREEIVKALADADGGNRYIRENSGGGSVFTERDGATLRANIMNWNLKNHTTFAKRLAMAKAAAAGVTRIVPNTSEELLATYDPAKKDSDTQGIEIFERK